MNTPTFLLQMTFIRYSFTLSSITDLLKHPCFCRPFLGALFAALDYTDNDYYQLFSLCLIYAMQSNAGINRFKRDLRIIPLRLRNLILRFVIFGSQRVARVGSDPKPAFSFCFSRLQQDSCRKDDQVQILLRCII